MPKFLMALCIWNDITDECVIIPAEGTEITEPGDIMIDVQYDGKSLGTFWVAVTEVNVIASGDWWTLYIGYDGDMPDYDSYEDRPSPWEEYLNQITSVTMSNSVTRIGAGLSMVAEI